VTAADGLGSVVLAARVKRSVAARVDAVRGSLTRSDWVALAVLSQLESGSVVPAMAGDAGRAERLGGALGLAGALRAASERPALPRCSHGPHGLARRGRYCVKCRSVTDAEGWPIRLP
jgi:hypothetical protein